jgi:PAS domain S-box-containing protein
MNVADGRNPAEELDEKKLAAEALRNSEERLRLATQTGKIGFWDWDIVSNQVSWTDEIYAIHGVNRETFNATLEGFTALIHPEDREAVSRAVEQAVQDDEKYEIEFRAVRPDGEVAWLFTNASVLREDGRPIRMLGAVMDITQRKATEEALRESNRRFARFMQHLPGLAWIKDLDGRYVFANNAAERAWQQPLAELYGRRDEEIFSPEDAAHFRDTDRQAISNAMVLETIEANELEDRLRHFIVRKFPIPNPDGMTSLIGGIAIDITERVKAEEALRISEQTYRAIGELINYGVWVCDPEGRNIYASESFLKLVGMTQEECSNFGWGDVLHPDDFQSAIDAWKECVKTGGYWDIEHRFRGVDGKWHPILARGVPVRNERGEITAWAGINLDISRLKQVEQELREADRRKDEFLATLAHELRNPLAPIRNGLQIMRLVGDDPEALEQARHMMERQLGQMVRLIDDLLDLSRISRGKIDLRKEVVDLSVIVKNAIETARPLIEQLGHEFALKLPPEPVWVEADVTRLAQVFANLLNNATKYTEKGGIISLTVTRHDEEVEVMVKDNGIGIPEQMLGRVFEMFTQVDRPSPKYQGGLGIGLSITKRLVEMHDGQVEARSEGPGLGSQFVVRLPLAALPVADSPASADDEEDVDVSAKQRIVIADDHLDSLSSLAMMLKIGGNDVRTARHGIEAIEVAAAFQPAVILLDIGMPELNGYETCRRIRKEPWGSEIIMIALTGWGQEEDKRKSKEAGFDYHLVKPVDPDVLEKLLTTLPAKSS